MQRGNLKGHLSFSRCTQHISLSVVDDSILQALAGVHEIDLEYCKGTITPKGLSLVGVHTIALTGTHVTDEGLKCISGAKGVHLQLCEQVTATGIKYLAGAQCISCDYCYRGLDTFP